MCGDGPSVCRARLRCLREVKPTDNKVLFTSNSAVVTTDAPLVSVEPGDALDCCANMEWTAPL